MSRRGSGYLSTEGAPEEPASRSASFRPGLLLDEEHDLCPGCGEPVALRVLLEAVENVGCAQSCIGSVGIGCYTALTPLMDADLVIYYYIHY